MSYRATDEALRTRVAELESDLAAAHGRIAALEGRASGGPTPGPRGHSATLGGPTGVTHTTTLPYELSPAGFEALAEVARARLRLVASQVGRTLRTPGGELEVRSDGGATTITLKGEWAFLPRGVVALASMSAAFGAACAAGILHDAARITMLHALWIGPLVALVVFMLARRRARRSARAQRQQQQGVFEALRAVAEQHALRTETAGSPRTRVDLAAEGATGSAPAEDAVPGTTRAAGR